MKTYSFTFFWHCPALKLRGRGLSSFSLLWLDALSSAGSFASFAPGCGVEMLCVVRSSNGRRWLYSLGFFESGLSVYYMPRPLFRFPFSKYGKVGSSPLVEADFRHLSVGQRVFVSSVRSDCSSFPCFCIFDIISRVRGKGVLISFPFRTSDMQFAGVLSVSVYSHLGLNWVAPDSPIYRIL